MNVVPHMIIVKRAAKCPDVLLFIVAPAAVIR